MNTLGEKIKAERLKANLSQKELAIKANISNSFLCDIEKDRTKPSIETLLNISSALEITDLNIFLKINYVNNDKVDTA